MRNRTYSIVWWFCIYGERGFGLFCEEGQTNSQTERPKEQTDTADRKADRLSE